MALDRISFGSVYARDLRTDYINDNKLFNKPADEIRNTEASDLNTDNEKQLTEDTAVKAPLHSNPNDFTFDFSKKNNYNLVAASNDIEDVDINRVVSDMKQDDVLSRYRYFVGGPNLGTDSDGTVRIVRE